MRELSLNILDITENSIKAKAKLIKVLIFAKNNLLTILVEDDGIGMSAEFLKNVTSPFTTTRTTRKVGMGIPLIKMEAEMSGGEFEITSKEGVGTTLKASFLIDHIDRPPLGDLAETVVSIVAGLGEAELILDYRAFECKFTLDTREVKKQLEGVPISTPEVLIFLRELINDNIKTKFAGVSL